MNPKSINVLILLCLLVLTVNFQSLGQEATLNDYTGNWTDDNSWSDGTAIRSTALPESNGDITINGYITLGSSGSNQDLSFAPNNDSYDFIINDTLVVYGNVDFGNKSMNLVINSGGLLIIIGDLDMNNKIDIDSDGNLVVTGTFSKTGSQGSYTGSGNVYAGNYSGDASDIVPDSNEKNADSDLQNDLPDIYDFVNGNSPLPVELVSFQATHNNSKAILTWHTATELNNDFFTIQRSKDGANFEDIGTVAGMGTTNQPQTYTFRDENPLAGTSYYRLKQTDFDGTTEIFKPVLFEMISSSSHITVFPNPVSGNKFKININGISNSANLKIVNLHGEEIYNQLVNNARNEELTINQVSIKPGIYIAILYTNLQQETFKFVKK